MSNNIWGYQGLQTPLENLTRGDYNVGDYTNMRKEFNARITALENAGGFNPTNVVIQGFCNLVPGTQGFGDLIASGKGEFGGLLNVTGQVTCSSGLAVTGTLTAGSFNPASVNTSAAVISGNLSAGTITSGDIGCTSNIYVSGVYNGNGSGLTNVTANDPNKLPLTGGNLSGNLNVNGNVTVSGFGFRFIGDGSGLTNVPSIPDATKLSLSGGSMTGPLTTQNIIVSNGYSITGNGSQLSTANLASFDNVGGGPAWVPAANYSKYLHLVLNYSNAVTVRLQNMGFTGANFPDFNRTITITKKAVASGDYIMTLSLPAQSGYTWRWITPASDGGTANIQMLVGTSSFTFNLITNGFNEGYAILISSVKV
jgi:hypothetical protein